MDDFELIDLKVTSKTRCCSLRSTNHSVSGVLQIERSSDRKSRSGSCRQSLPAFLFALSSSASRGSSAFGACVRAHIGSPLPALVAFAAAPCDDIDQIVTAVIVGNLGACSDVLYGAYDDLVAYSVGLGIGPARMICVTSEVLSARGFLVGRCWASSAGRFPRTSLRVRGFAGARGVVDFGGKRHIWLLCLRCLPHPLGPI